MSTQTAPVQTQVVASPPQRRRSRLKHWVVAGLVLAVLGGLGWGTWRLLLRLNKPEASAVPTTHVRRSDVTFTIAAPGRLQGGSPEALSAPMTGEGEVRITFLRNPGEIVHAGDTVVEFDSTDQALKLKEAEADLAEAEQQVAKAEAERGAQQEENRYQLSKARADVHQSELDMRKNRLLAAISARQNELALEAARDRLAQLEKDLASRGASNEAAIQIQEAVRKKAQSAAERARKNIENMTVKATRDGYVSVKQNTRSSGFYTRGMSMPLFRVGDRASPGVTVAEIPDLKNWEVVASIAEEDRGLPAEVTVVALPYLRFHGHVSNLGGMSDAFWDRKFELRVTLDDPSPELRPGTNVRLVITTEVLKGALWLPRQALFESDGRTQVYVPSGSGFSPREVKLVRRSESQAVITGLSEGQPVALVNPEEQQTKRTASGGATQAISHK